MAARGMGTRYQGSKWIRREKRLAIYLRDGLCCAYCGQAVEDGATLTLDHLTPYHQGGSHHQANLVTACLRCNSSRGDRDVATFAKAVAEYLGRDAGEITERIERIRHAALDVKAAKDIIARRGWKDAIR